MSRVITVNQRPLTLTPSNTEHIYNVISTNIGETDYRYVFDIWVDTNTANPQKITRLITAPNSYGKGIINVDEIISNYVEGNARSESPQYTSQTTTGNTPYSIITNTKGFSTSNAYNGNDDYNTQVHVRDYRVMVGEQWTSGTTTVTFISTEVDIPGSTMTGAVVSGRPSWYGAGANIPEGSALQTGVEWYYQGTSGTSSNLDGNILPVSPTPVAGYTVEIIEKYSGIQMDFEYTGFEWLLLGYTWPAGTDYEAFYSPPAVTIWPGTSLKQGTYTPYLSNNDYWTATSPDTQHEWWEAKTYLMSGTTVNESQPSRFLTTAGDELFTINSASAGINTSRVRRRRHHPSCPILISWFNGFLSENANFEFNNDLQLLGYASASTQSGDYLISWEEEYPYHSYTGITPQNERILYWNQIQPDLAGGKIAFWLANSVGNYQYDGYGYSEILEYYLEQDDCLSDPVHVLFLNRQGVWDTYTLDRKALESNTITRDIYSQTSSLNNDVYSLLSTNRRKTIFYQELTQEMTVNTWYLTDNDKQIVEDLFLSPEVYIIEDHDWTGKTEKSYNPYLLPVVLKTNSIQEYKNRYNKLVQYTFTLEYTPINKYYTQG